jgi:hypothetical protein
VRSRCARGDRCRWRVASREKISKRAQNSPRDLCLSKAVMKTVSWKFLLSAAGILAIGCATPPPDGAYPNAPDDEPPLEVDDDGLAWQRANLTTFESYPTSEEECVEFSGCDYAGSFAAVRGKQSMEWVKAHDIIAVHEDFYDEYKLKTLRVRANGEEIDAVVYDMCSDADCDGCCTRNMSETGFLIDMESFTADRFGREGGVVEWACIDC